MKCFGSILKSYYAKKTGIEPEKMYVVSVMPCVAKKYEKIRDGLKNNGLENVDSVIKNYYLCGIFNTSASKYPTFIHNILF